jgi:hypothetical protein
MSILACVKDGVAAGDLSDFQAALIINRTENEIHRAETGIANIRHHVSKAAA